MLIRTLSAVSLVLALATSAAAQNASPAVAAASKAMGVDSLNSITYSGTARNGAFGQSKAIGDPMGPVNVTQITQYTRTINFAAPTDQSALVSRATGPTQPPTVPGVAAQPAGVFNQNITAAQLGNNFNQALNVWTTPWGFLKGAAANNATVRQQGGQQVVSFSPANLKSPSGQPYTVTGYLDNQNRVVKVETKVDHAVVGDLPIEFEYSNYQAMNGVQVPGRMVQKQAGMTTFEATITSATPNPPNLTELLTAPPAPARAGGPGAPAGPGGPPAAAGQGAPAAGGRGAAAGGGQGAPAGAPAAGGQGVPAGAPAAGAPAAGGQGAPAGAPAAGQGAPGGAAPGRAGGPGGPGAPGGAAPGGPGGQQAANAPPPVEKIGEGVFRIGGNYTSLAVDMGDHVLVVESGQSDARGQAVMAAAKQAIPGKPIRFVVNSHPHFDHASGLAAAVAEGATILTHRNNEQVLERLLSGPRTLTGDSLSKVASRRTDVVTGVGDRDVRKGTNNKVVELIHVPNEHSDGMLVVYLPAEKVLWSADVTAVNPNPVQLATLKAVNTATGKLDYTAFIPAHPPNPERPLTKMDVTAAAAAN